MIQPPKTYAVRRLSARGWEWVNAVGQLQTDNPATQWASIIHMYTIGPTQVQRDHADAYFYDDPISYKRLMRAHDEKSEAALAARNAQGNREAK